MEAAAGSTNLFTRSLLRNAEAMTVTTNRSWLHNQALFTARRYAFYATLAVTGLIYEVGKLGFEYNSMIQTAREALRPIFSSNAALDGVISRLYKVSTLSPFLFKDTLGAFRTLYPAFHAVGISASDAINTIQGAANALAVSGKLSSGQLTRIGVQLQHLANIGRPTGQILLALARDGLPVYPALRKELGLTGTSLENVASSGLTAQQVIRALNRYMLTAAPYAGAAFRLTTRTLQGNWQMLKDILAQAAGSAEGGLFGGLTRRLRAVNTALMPLLLSNRPIGLYQIAQAFDRSLTPSTHIILNLFIFLTTTLRTIIFEFGILARAIGILLWPLNRLLSLFGMGNDITRLYAVAIGTLITLYLAARLALLPFTIALATWELVTVAARAAAQAYSAWLVIMSFAADMATRSFFAMTVAMLTNPFILLAAAVIALTVGLVILYFKWKAFHDFVNRTWYWLQSHPLVTSFIAIIGPLIVILQHLTQIYHMAQKIYNLARHPVRAVEHGGGGFFHHPLNYLPLLTGFATGGVVGRGGLAVVGERGPELVHLPSASVVQPLTGNSLVGAGSIQITVIPQPIYFDGKMIGQALARVVTDKEARMGGR